MSSHILGSEGIADYVEHLGEHKTHRKWWIQLLLGVMAGIFIALASYGSGVASYGVHPTGLGKALAGALFSTGLMLVVCAGGDLFTGNNLILMSVLEKKNKLLSMLQNWILVYSGNFIGSLFVVFLVYISGGLNTDEGAVGGYFVKTAIQKTSFDFSQALALGILCNILVCLACWMAYGAKDMAGKLLGIFFPIWLFITSGYEHCVANMFYIPMGLAVKGNAQYMGYVAEHYPTVAEQAGNLTIGNFLLSNLLPVTIGNIIGGSLIIGGIYWMVYLKPAHNVYIAEK